MKGLLKFSIFFIALCCCLSAFHAQAQTQDSYDYQSEFTWGINKNTFGGLIGGFVFKKARKLNDKLLETYGLEIMNVKHPQEVRTNAPRTGNFFIFGKSSYLYALRFQYGRDMILFKKAPQQGVEIKLVTAIGPTLGIVAPYYIEVAGDGYSGISYYERYDPDKHKSATEIFGPGRLFQGLFGSETEYKFGANLKAGVNFELGTTKNQVTGFEAGFLLDAYTSPVIIMPTTKNYSAFPTLYFTLFYGGRK